MRTGAQVRRAEVDDLSALIPICLEARAESGAGIQLSTAEERGVLRHLQLLVSLPGGEVLVAYDDGAVVGFLLLRTVTSAILVDAPTVYVEAVYVQSDARRRGVGHALLAAVAEIADHEGAADVYAVPLPGARGVQRFLARLGFAPAGGHRVVATPVLQRRLATDAAPSRRSTRSLEDLIARRRRARTEGLSGPVDLRAFQRSYQEGMERDALEPTPVRRSADDEHFDRADVDPRSVRARTVDGRGPERVAR
ncbi:ribosomal protein S18 acetylase RimI-like enzyme [Sediminihabitans luteus]|uniref:Ribosomal protein S18 acetylase RimI-like enzyme n=1 Tax=Sediminihabitans luteus TaxID=1138585 RepID=A0A2M9CR67_9CELL|nr:GNAT family N-acetyltransferase [Sediminihabitans luteus]PJJ74328.1 ribosomal protein S18 acetylase RimI-like enzyme [Sediminihabitans luteus]GIJ00440.1 hypothetical protein Slu03_28170 [Sediminihabitans luteus]